MRDSLDVVSSVEMLNVKVDFILHRWDRSLLPKVLCWGRSRLPVDTCCFPYKFFCATSTENEPWAALTSPCLPSLVLHCSLLCLFTSIVNLSISSLHLFSNCSPSNCQFSHQNTSVLFVHAVQFSVFTCTHYTCGFAARDTRSATLIVWLLCSFINDFIST